jgi:putative CocE/NonD family hydrolase
LKKCLALGLLILFAIGSSDAAIRHHLPDAPAAKVSRPGFYRGYSTADYKGFKYTSCYVPMRDSVRLAVDIFLPQKLAKGKKIPTILYLTRYVRSIQARFPFSLFMDPILAVVDESEIRYFTSYGYACVIVDVRGTGASQGDRRMEFSPEEVADGDQIVDWIVSQPWSDSLVGTTGVSYLGTTAEMLLANKNPHVKACIPRSGIFDLYKAVIFPGGVCQGPFIDIWGRTTRSLDNNDFSPFTKQTALITGIHPVTGDKHHALLKQAIANHKKNFDITSGLQELRFRDDVHGSVGASSDDFSVHTHLAQIASSGTAIYRIGGWYDGALARSSLDASQNTPNTRKVLIGPWDHGPADNASPFALSKKVNFNIYAEMLRFFDYYLKGIDNGIENEPKYSYYTVGEESWETSNSWPPRDTAPKKLYLSSDKSLTPYSIQTIHSGAISYDIDYTATSGLTSRWNSVTDLYKHGHTDYPDRREEDKKLLGFTSDPITEPMEITGHPIVRLNLSADADDATIFCYLEDVSPDGTVTYVTEGMIRPIDRKVTTDLAYHTPYPDHSYRREDQLKFYRGEIVKLEFDLLPISYQFKKGHSIRLSIAGADAGHFNPPSPKPTHLDINTSPLAPSYIELPVVVR